MIYDSASTLIRDSLADGVQLSIERRGESIVLRFHGSDPAALAKWTPILANHVRLLKTSIVPAGQAADGAEWIV